MAEERKLEGWLMKQGEGAFGKGYKKRWFSQTGTCLYYYKQRSDSENAGFINLAEEGAKGKFQAETEDAMHYWVEGIKQEFGKIKEADEGSGFDRRSVRLETSENRIRDLEAREIILKKGLAAACQKLGVPVDQVLSEVEGGGATASQLASEVSEMSGGDASSGGGGAAAAAEESKSDASSGGAAAAADSASESGPSGGGDGKKDKRFKAKVLYDYTAQQDYEMTIHTGEIIMVLSKHGNGWWLGASAEGKQGYFPGSYVEPIQAGQ